MANSTASGQRCLYCQETYPLWPPVIGGCPKCSAGDFKAPLEVTYDYPEAAGWLPEAALPGIDRYAPLLPYIAPGLSMGEGGTPLVAYSGGGISKGIEVYIKDEARNPTWSHKDRLNLIVTSAALHEKAPGLVAASSGNHGASAAAYAARAGLPAVILCTPRPPTVASFMQAYGQIVVAVPDIETRWRLMSLLVDEWGYHPASNQTTPPTNHPFGSEGYKTIAYELYLQLGERPPEAVFVPVGFSELIFGIYKGFRELKMYGLIQELPYMIACEPASGGAPLAQAMEKSQAVAYTDGTASNAYSIAVPVNSYRGVVALRDSEGLALALAEEEIQRGQELLSRNGIWSEFSAAAALAGALRANALDLGRAGALVCINTSSGFKDIQVGKKLIPQIEGSWESLEEFLQGQGVVKRDG